MKTENQKFPFILPTQWKPNLILYKSIKRMNEQLSK